MNNNDKQLPWWIIFPVFFWYLPKEVLKTCWECVQELWKERKG